jgi:VIT1/CCC1 family predicted Fe2+/Mn2+ transporter
VAYIAGSMVPILPVLFGAKNMLISLLAASFMLALVSLILAFMSGMNIKRRVLTNLVIGAMAVSVTYLLGSAAKAVFGVSV